ncbi:MAG: endo-1,3-1,4-beta-glycanase ExsH [Microcystis aeruginosa DA14]|uniref:Endo-1,3-1,4-beta-glycanase ExsH n=1 Tax=Microcystis aeruginosa DA14 TaxID=1987506 RepID=A0A3E0M081_MICAE|nr:MAG: endo-1,3-1,4-beta-glycanase ExsH [Microcystis aeruginosa DA14]
MTSTLLPSLPAIYDVLFDFAQSDGFWANLETAFGTSYDVVKATQLRQQWQSRNFSQLPEIEVVNSSVLGSANGAYGISTNKIYLSESFFASASLDALVAVILEEIGHFVDAQINRVDTVGDEGELFSHLVRGVNLTEAELTYIQAEDDRSVIDLGGQFIGVEQAAPITLIVNTTIDENDGSATIGSGLSLRDAVTIANKSPNTPYIIKLKSGTTYALTYVNNTTTGDRSLRTNGTITIETDGTALASIVNNASPISGENDYNSIISNSSQLGVTLNNLYISNKAGRGIDNDYGGTLTLNNSTITGNTATYGGGIDNNGTLTLTNSTISGNTGGGIHNWGTLTLTNSTITGNTAAYDGGGIVNWGTLTLTDSTITGNTAAYDGGGIVHYGTLTITNSTISGNTAGWAGGGIDNWGTLTLTNSTITGNTADGGGGIDNWGTLTLTNSTISGNTADDGGGIVNWGTLTLTNSTISGNTATVYYGSGGGIDNLGWGTLTITDSTISGNTATYGGGISNDNWGTLTLTDSTITGNTATYGGGIYNDSWGTLTLTNNILTNNNANLGGGIYNRGTWSSNSIISGHTANQVWYIDLEDPDGHSTTDKSSWIDGKLIANPIDPKYPNIYDEGTFTALPPTPNPPPKPTISVSNAWVDVPAGTNQTKVLKFEVKLSSAYDKPITVDYYTLDGSANSIDSKQLKDFNNVVKQTLSFFPGQTSKQIEITVLGSALPTDQTFEILAKDTAYRNWTDTDKGKEVDKIYDYSDLGYEGYRINKVFKDSTTGFDAFGLTSDEKFFLVLANPLNANEFKSSSNNLLQDIANTSGGNNTAAYTAGQNLINQLTSTKQSYTFTDGTIYDLAKPPVLAIRGTEFSSVNDLLSDAETEGIGYNQFTNNKAAVNQWLSEVTNPVSGLTLKPNITGHSLGGALSQWVGGSYTGQLGKIVTFNSPGISQQPGINFNATNNLGVTHYITSADLVSIAGSKYLSGVWNLEKYSKLTSAITFEKHSVPVLNQTITRTNLSKPTDLTRKVANGNTTDLSSYWFTYLPDADYFALQMMIRGLGSLPIPGIGLTGTYLAAALTYRGTVELNRQAIGSAIDGLGNISDAVTSAYNAAKSWTSDAWDAIIGQSDKKLGLSPSTANQSNSTLKLASSFLDTNSYEIATTATASQTIDNFWDAIPDWGNNAWQATTKWSGDAWKSIDEWTPQTWQATTTWTAADWNKPFFTISNPTIVENNSGTNNLIFKVTLSTTSTQTITVNYATANNTATAGSDYTAKTGTLTFTPGQISQDIIISVNGDTAIEPDETFLINLANPSNALITDNQGLGTITNDDGDNTSVTLAVSPGSVTEDGTTNLVYTFTRTGVTTNPLTVNYTLGGTATLNTDYTRTGTNNTVTFAAGSTTAKVTIDPTADTTVEPNETVILTLAAGTGYKVGTTTPVTGTITNDDFPQLSINDITVVEGKDNNAILTVTVDNPNPQPITFNYTTAPINATANVDYTSKTGTLTIAPNTATATISIPILNDNLNEPDEAFTVTLSNPVNATINPDEAIGQVIITDTLQSAITRTLPNNVENLRLIGSNNINGTGNAGNNKITGNNGINQINGGAGIDTLTGGLGADIFIFQFGQSTISTSDRITDFAINSDKIDLLTQTGNATSAPSNFSRAANSTVTTLQNLVNQVFTDANGAITGNQGLGVNSAALVQVTTGAIAGTYLVINDSTAGFQSSNDLLINITGFTGALPALGNIPVGNFFI